VKLTLVANERRQKRTEPPRPQLTSTENFVKFGRVVHETCKQRDRQTDRRAHRNMPLPYRGLINNQPQNNSVDNKAVIDCRLRPRCRHPGSYFKRPKSSPVRPLACNWYYCAQFIAKPKAACALRFSWSATSSNLGLLANMASSIKPEVHNVSLRRQRRTETRAKNWAKIGRVDPKI